MKALILVGGFGTRLRPLTLTCPKPIIQFCNKPILLHQIEALAKVGVKHFVLAVSKCADKNDSLEIEMKKFEEPLNIKISFSYEHKAMGTAGPIALARDILLEGDTDFFFVLNSDIICEFPFASFLEFHTNHSGEASILVTKVEEPSKYGVIVFDEANGLVDRFVEKPLEFVGNKINAGIYILNKSVIDRISLKPTSIEREIFPEIAKAKGLFCQTLTGFWMDIGQPKDFLIGSSLYLNYLSKMIKSNGDTSILVPSAISKSILLPKSDNIIDTVLIDPSAKIDPTAVLGPSVVIGPDVVIEKGARIRNSTILRGSVIKAHSYLDSTIVGWSCEIGKWSRLENITVLGEDVIVADEIYLNSVMVLPHKSISKSIHGPEIVM